MECTRFNWIIDDLRHLWDLDCFIMAAPFQRFDQAVPVFSWVVSFTGFNSILLLPVFVDFRNLSVATTPSRRFRSAFFFERLEFIRILLSLFFFIFLASLLARTGFEVSV